MWQGNCRWEDPSLQHGTGSPSASWEIWHFCNGTHPEGSWPSTSVLAREDCVPSFSPKPRPAQEWPNSSAIGEGNGTPLQNSCLENPMDGGAWWATVHGVAKSRTRLSDFTFTFHFSLSCIGEGNGNPLQCSCLENPRDRGGLVGCRLWGRTESDTTEAT